MTEKKTNAFSKFMWKAVETAAVAAVTCAVLLGVTAAGGMPIFDRVVSSVMGGASIEEIVRSTTTTETDIITAKSILAEVGGGDVEIIVTNDNRNCAVWGKNFLGFPERKTADDGVEVQGGCWRSSTPNSIYISEDITHYKSLQFVVLHEYAHVLQYREELAEEIDGISNEATHDCIADAWAYHNGASEDTLFYFNSGDCAEMRFLLEEDGLQGV